MIFFIPGLLSDDFAKYTKDRWLTVTVTDADNFTLDGVDSSGWSGTYSRGGKFAKEIRLRTGSLPFKRVIAKGGLVFSAAMG